MLFEVERSDAAQANAAVNLSSAFSSMQNSMELIELRREHKATQEELETLKVEHTVLQDKYDRVQQILEEQDYLRSQRKKSKESVVEENNLLPNLNFRVGVSLLLTLFAAVFVILGYIASTDERFYDKDFGYWSMLLGGLGLLITLNLFVIRVVQAIRFQLNKRQAIEDLADKFISKLETDYESLENKIRTRIFGLESVVFMDACKTRMSEEKIAYKELLSNFSNHFK